MELLQIRDKIDAVDKQLVELFCARMELCAEIAQVKKQQGLPVLDSTREQQKLQAVAALAAPQHQQAVQQLYGSIFSLSRAYQQTLLEEES
ncbi:MAG: chorismate mutase [Oscillospiraceae bacterium]|nr:chorismate mutase [Oscillospiraceae bacterium]